MKRSVFDLFRATDAYTCAKNGIGRMGKAKRVHCEGPDMIQSKSATQFTIIGATYWKKLAGSGPYLPLERHQQAINFFKIEGGY